jgi:23S rRNA pseudouridine1911/1915/1917 synthase
VRLVWQIQMADHGRRAVDVLIQRTGMSRLMSKRIRIYGQLTCNGLPHKMIDPVYSGDLLVAVDLSGAGPGLDLRQVPDVQVCYQDIWLAVLGKPAGLVTHPSYLHEKIALTSLLSDQPLHPVSRLDRDTSGIVLIARNGHAHHVLTRHPMRKIYFAAVHGRLPAAAGLIQAPVRRSSGSIIRREIHPDGSPARTIWQELHYYKSSDVSLVRFELLTGRTHQIRLHSASAGCPLIGDSLYGKAFLPDEPDSLDALIGRQALHAASILFSHPVSGQPMRFTARLPDDFRQLLRELYRREDWLQVSMRAKESDCLIMRDCSKS